MTREFNQELFEFHPLNERQAVGRFDGGTITTDAGALLSCAVALDLAPPTTRCTATHEG